MKTVRKKSVKKNNFDNFATTSFPL